MTDEAAPATSDDISTWGKSALREEVLRLRAILEGSGATMTVAAPEPSEKERFIRDSFIAVLAHSGTPGVKALASQTENAWKAYRWAIGKPDGKPQHILDQESRAAEQAEREAEVQRAEEAKKRAAAQRYLEAQAVLGHAPVAPPPNEQPSDSGWGRRPAGATA